MTRSARIFVLTCLWRRLGLAELVLSRYARLRGELSPAVDLQVMVVGSEGRATRDLAAERGFHYVEHANRPLGSKWNAGVAGIRAHEPDAIVVAGSDDFVDASLFRFYRGELEAGTKCAGLRDMYVLDLVTGRACHWQGYRGGRAHKLLGLGRLIHRSLLETVDWELWTPSRNRGLDSDMSARLRRYVGSGLNVRHLRCADADTVAIDVKTQVNMWDYDQMQRSGNTRPIELQAFLGRHFSCDERDALERLAADGTWKRSLR